MNSIRLLDLFSGIGGFSQGLKQAGFELEKHYFSEVNKHAIAIYHQQFTEAEYVGSVVNVSAAALGRVDAITFGSPCQDFSMAGKRAGLNGERSSLVRHAIRLISELRPKFFIWENVKGAFSSNGGADFWAIIQAFADIGGYRLEWQLLNTSWFLPQNRERIYLVGVLAGECERPIFSERKTARFCPGAISIKQEIHADSEPALTQTARQFSSWCGTYVNCDQGIRSLTEIECERLQGFSDNWTQYGIYDGDKREVSGAQRYKCLGNAVSVPVVEFVGQCVLEALWGK